ncbi:hypothetical protein [Streptomyces pini]|uniref:hypothetical protein n=1 Tax=Streptomyces pini TaxID=1520580 RepID=UPI0011149171|nr:hypothetical protein [Streptomyces pini]
MSNLIAAAAVVVSLVALYFSGAQFRLNKRIQLEAAQPYVVPDIQPRAGGSGLLVFTLENVGPTVARDVEISIDPPLKGGERDVWDERLGRALGRKISHLPPRRRLEWFFTFAPRFYQRTDLPRQYTVTVKANGPSGPVEEMSYIIDLDAMEGTALDRATVVAKLDKIAKHIAERDR